MRIAVNGLQLPRPNVRINFRRHNRRMPEQRLNRSKIGAVLKHVSRRVVPEAIAG